MEHSALRQAIGIGWVRDLLTTPDVAAKSFGALTFYLFRRWVNKLSWAFAYGVGLSLSLAELTKSTWIIAPALIVMRWVVTVIIRGRLKLVSAVRVAFIFSIAWFVFVLEYTGNGLFKPLSDYRFQSIVFGAEHQHGVNAVDRSERNRFVKSFLGCLPLPEQFILEMDVQKSNFERTTLSYLRGELRSSGWWFYDLYGVGVKSTVGVLVIVSGKDELVMINDRGTVKRVAIVEHAGE